MPRLNHQRSAQAQPSLSPQQRRVVRLLAHGCSTKVIAARLGISERTAQWHVSRLMERFDVPTRAALMRAVDQAGLLPRVPRLRARRRT